MEEHELVRPQREDQWFADQLGQEVAGRSAGSGSKDHQGQTTELPEEGSGKQGHENSPWDHERLHEDVHSAVAHQHLDGVVTGVALQMVAAS